MDYENIIDTLKEQLNDEIRLSAINKEYIVFLENKIENLEKSNLIYLNKIKELEEKIDNQS